MSTGRFGDNGFRATDTNGKDVPGGAEVTDSELGAPFYPGSIDLSKADVKVNGDSGTIIVSSRATEDDPPNVIAFYKGKLGKEDSSIISGATSMITWKEGMIETTVMVTRGDAKGSTKIAVCTSTDK